MTLQAIIEEIQSSVTHLTSQTAFTEWLANEKLSSGDHVLINNSFVYRDVKTNKSGRYLGLAVDELGALQLQPLVCVGSRMNLDFKRIDKKSPTLSLLTLEEAVTDEISKLGKLLFILIGEVEDTTILTENINHAAFDVLVWNPSAMQPVEIDDKQVIVRETYDDEPLSEALLKHYESLGEQVPDGLAGALGIALDKLQDKAVASVRLPTADTLTSPGITDSIVQVLKEQRDHYAAALSKIGVDNAEGVAALTEILRIAYNFASDATTYLNLIVSVCDLKAIVLWGTIAEHFALSEAFKTLPWTRSRNKASMDNYTQTISDARNSAFHNLFPFRKSLNLALPGSAFHDAELRIFSEHRKKKDNRLNYQDRELVDLLVEFTRARERRVPARFWRQNLVVMDTTIDLFSKTSSFLKLLHEVLSAIPSSDESTHEA